MVRSYRIRGVLLAGTVAGALAAVSSCAGGEQNGGGGIEIDADDIGGVVTSTQGPEAGVWVVAETTDLPTRFIRIVATDDQGRYVLPDLPDATYEVFVRGYGLVDSPRVSASPGQLLDLEGVVAPDPRAAAEVYPAAWWLSMVELPDGELSHQQVGSAMTGCLNCHQLGNKATREIPDSIASEAASSLEAWDHRMRVGPWGQAMGGMFQRFGEQRQLFADWTDRIANGEAPTQTPPRPTGIERNVVVTLWDWGTELDGRTDSTASDVRDATVNANGLVYGVVQPRDLLLVLDPVEHRASTITIPSNASQIQTNSPESPYWGDEDIWARSSDPRSVAIDGQGRVWLTGRVRDAQDQPEFCADESNRYADYYPLTGNRQVFMYDPETEVFSEIDTCFSTDHNQIGDNGVIYYGVTNAAGWIDMEIWDETQDAEAAQGWCPAVLDTNGDGEITPGWTEPDEAIDPARDHRIQFGCYAPAVNPADGSVWCSGTGPSDNKLVRIAIGSNPPESCMAEVFEAPPSVTNPPAYGTGGIHITTEGVVWQDWRGSGHFASFDRSLCAVTTGPEATGQSCPEGWTFHRMTTKPTYQNAEFPINSDESYLTQVDHHDVLGLGRDVPLYGVVNTDSLEVFVPDTEQFVTLRVPYPMGFFSRSSNGRIDDPSTGWKGKGLWSSYSSWAAWHLEGGPGTLQKAVKFQIRPTPLAK